MSERELERMEERAETAELYVDSLSFLLIINPFVADPVKASHFAILV